MEIKCRFYESSLFPYRYVKYYKCSITRQQIPEDQELKFIEERKSGTTKNYVDYLDFDQCTVTKVPQGLTKIFPNLKILEIRGSKLKQISKNDLAEYKNLDGFFCKYNELEFLPGDLFEDFKNLKWIDFYENNLKVIEPNILDGLNKLRMVTFRNNNGYKKSFLDCQNYGSKETLQEVKDELSEKLFSKYKFLHDLRQSEETFRQENRQLKNSEAKLRVDWENEKLENSKLTQKIQKGFFNDVRKFTQDEVTKDFKIKISDREFPVHKFLLAARSPTLAEILRNNPEVENLNLVDISVEIFEKIFKFLYTDELPREDGTNFLHLFATAGRLKIGKLIDFAATMVMDQIDEENMMEILKLSNKYEHDELRQKTFEQIKECHPKIKFKDELVGSVETVVKIIEAFKMKEEIIKKAEEEFESLIK